MGSSESSKLQLQISFYSTVTNIWLVTQGCYVASLPLISCLLTTEKEGKDQRRKRTLSESGKQNLPEISRRHCFMSPGQNCAARLPLLQRILERQVLWQAYCHSKQNRDSTIRKRGEWRLIGNKQCLTRDEKLHRLTITLTITPLYALYLRNFCRTQNCLPSYLGEMLWRVSGRSNTCIEFQRKYEIVRVDKRTDYFRRGLSGHGKMMVHQNTFRTGANWTKKY